MNGQSYRNSQTRDEGERPFWISYADLMTTLMVLFLVIMVASLSQVSSKRKSTIEQIHKRPTSIVYTTVTAEAEGRENEISAFCEKLSEQTATVNNNISVDCSRNRISLGEGGQYKIGEYVLSKEGEQAIYDLLPVVLSTATSQEGKKWLKQVVIEGFTDTDGSYLYNLKLSLRRSEWVMCKILSNTNTNALDLDSSQRKQIKQLIVAGGVSFNNTQYSRETSGKVELQLHFYDLDEPPLPNVFDDRKFEDDPHEQCHV